MLWSNNTEAMGKNRFTIELEGQQKSVSVPIAKPDFVAGWWTTDAEGCTPLKESKLGETVYFHVETKGIAEGKEIELSLAEYDYNGSGGFLFFDIIDPDDRKFPEDAVIKKARIQQKGDKHIASLELFLDEKWQGIIKDDHDVWFSLDESIELYWEIVYGSYKKSLPKKTENYLRVTQSDRTLYFKPPIVGHNLPELMSKDGSPLLLMEFIKGKVKGKIISKALKFIKDEIGTSISTIALTKLERGSLVTNTGRVQTNAQSIIYQKDTYTNDGTLIEDLKSRKNWGNANETTKGISQYDYFTQTGKRVRILGFLKNIDTALDFFDLLKFGMKEELNTASPLGSMGLGAIGAIGGAFALVNSVAGLLVKQMKEEDSIYMEEVVQKELRMAKETGLEGIRRFVHQWGHNEEYKYILLPLFEETVNELLNGKFLNISDTIKFNHETDSTKPPLFLLYRVQMNFNKERIIEVVDTIICNY